jgi:hypothetical protein
MTPGLILALAFERSSVCCEPTIYVRDLARVGRLDGSRRCSNEPGIGKMVALRHNS